MSVEILVSNFTDATGTYWRLSPTVLSWIVFVSASLSKMFDVGDLPVQTYGY